MSGGWKWAAACRGVPARLADLAFGTAEEQQTFIGQFCWYCPVKRECFDYGRDEHGVFGGMTQKKRGDMLGRQRDRPKAAA